MWFPAIENLRRLDPQPLLNCIDSPQNGRRALPELRELLFLADHLGDVARVETLATINHGELAFPLLAVHFGPNDPTAPVFALFGGVHGLERIGTRILIAYLQTIMALARWDRCTQDMLQRTRLLFVPLVNPVGMYLQRRANGNSVDLMRNAPIDAEGLAPWHLFGGQRMSSRIPWYRGTLGAPMELEAQALCDWVRREIFPARIALSVDVHSGYGHFDRFWFPYARTKAPLPAVAQVVALDHLLHQTHAHHVYRVEPQSLRQARSLHAGLRAGAAEPPELRSRPGADQAADRAVPAAGFRGSQTNPCPHTRY